jgi:hypothetical protein
LGTEKYGIGKKFEKWEFVANRGKLLEIPYYFGYYNR